MNDTLIHALLDDTRLTLDELSGIGRVSPQWVIERVEAGLLDVAESDPASWRFDVVALHRVRCMVAVERDFDAVPELAALVADLQAEIQHLRLRLARVGLL